MSKRIGAERALVPVLRCWGKIDRESGAFHPALFHMVDAGNIALELLGPKASPRWRHVLGQTVGAEPESLVGWLPWLVALHDIGKISAAFQQQNAAEYARLKGEGFRFGPFPWRNDPHHTLVTQAAVVSALAETLPEKLLRAVSEAGAAHHGQFAGAGQLKDARRRLRREPDPWEEWRFDALGELRRLFVAPIINWPRPGNVSAAIMALTGFTILCDWLASDGTYFKPEPLVELSEYVALSGSRARDAVREAGFLAQTRSRAACGFAELFADKLPARPLQNAVDAIPASVLARPCLAIVEAPTGEGKTEAALALAHRLAEAQGTDEFYCALPTTATSNQMFVRVQEHLTRRLGIEAQVRLIHGQAFLVKDDLRLEPLRDDVTPDEDASLDWFAPKKRALLAPFGVGTIDQAELGALNVRHTALRLIGLAGKVLVLDEVHAYDTYMTTIVERLLNWLAALGTSVVLLSATLPKGRRAALIQAYSGDGAAAGEEDDAYPCLWIANGEESYRASPPAEQAERRIELIADYDFGDPESVGGRARWLLDAVADGGCACWVTNTVRRAQALFEAMDQAAGADLDCMLLHSQFPLEDRQRLEAELARKYGPDGKDRPARGVVIGTQVLEQSLDLDFDVMVTDLAPVDLLLQRAGRLHRHGRARPEAHCQPRLWICSERDAKGGLALGVDKEIYAEFILRVTWHTLKDSTEIVLPRDYRRLVQAVYGASEPPIGDDLCGAWEALQSHEQSAVQEAEIRLLAAPTADTPFSWGPDQPRFEESETAAGWIIAKTRLGEEGVTAIPVEVKDCCAELRTEEGILRVPLNEPAERDVQLRLLRRSVRIGNKAATRALKKEAGSRPRLFTDSPLLRDCFPVLLTRGSAAVPSADPAVMLTLHPRLGLRVGRLKGE